MASRLQKIRLGDLLIQNGIITAEQLDMTLIQQRRSGRKLGQELIAQHLVTEESLLTFLASQLHLERIDLSQQALDPQLVLRLPESLARRYRAIPVQDRGEHYVVGMADPTDLPALDAISRAMGKPVEMALISESQLLHILPQLYGAVSKSAELREALGDTVTTSAPPPILESSAEDAPIVRLLNAVFTDAAWWCSPCCWRPWPILPPRAIRTRPTRSPPPVPTGRPRAGRSGGHTRSRPPPAAPPASVSALIRHIRALAVFRGWGAVRQRWLVHRPARLPPPLTRSPARELARRAILALAIHRWLP